MENTETQTERNNIKTHMCIHRQTHTDAYKDDLERARKTDSERE